MVDRNSLFECRGRVPDKSTVKRRFRAISVTMRCCNTNVWRHCDSLATRLLRGVVSSDVAVVSSDFPALGGVRVAGESGKVPCDSHGDFLCRVCHTCFSALDRTPNPQSEPAVIVRHRIVKPRLDDELAALDCFRCRRPRAWRDANAVIANLIHPLVYAPGANMPQDALDDLLPAPTGPVMPMTTRLRGATANFSTSSRMRRCASHHTIVSCSRLEAAIGFQRN